MVIDTRPSERKTLIELKAKKTVKAAAAPETLEDRINAAYDAREGRPESDRTRYLREQGVGAADFTSGGAAVAAGVLTAVDEDEEGAEEAELPREFDYQSDAEEEKEGE